MRRSRKVEVRGPLDELVWGGVMGREQGAGSRAAIGLTFMKPTVKFS